MKRIGIVGTRWGRMHVGAFRAAGAEVAALCGRDLERTRSVAAEEGIPLAFDDVSALCAAVDVVVVASPDHLHAAHVEAAVHARRPVLCEKPLAATSAEADSIAAWVDAVRVPAATCFPYRMLPGVAALHAWLAGRGSRHVAVTVRTGFATGPSADFGGASHVIDAAMWLGGAKPKWVQASLAGQPPTNAFLHLGLAEGSTISITHLTTPEPGIDGRWSIVAADRSFAATVQAGYRPERNGWCVSAVLGHDAGTPITIAPSLEPVPGHREPWAEAHAETARRFLAMIAGQPHAPLPSFADGALTQRVLGTAIAANAAGRRSALSS